MDSGPLQLAADRDAHRRDQVHDRGEARITRNTIVAP
jgi:hypothetical protein